MYLFQDVSYLSCIELKGSYDQIIEGLMHHVNQDCGRTFKAKCYEQGTREGSIFMFKRDTYPKGAIGRVSFIWDTCAQEKTRALWIWSEPLIYKQLADEFQATFNLKQDDSKISVWDPPVLKKVKLGGTIKTRNDAVGSEQIPCFVSDTMRMTLLKGILNRLRLTGPMSNNVLNHVLYPASSINSKSSSEENWWPSHLYNFKESTIIQKELWESLGGANRPESYPPNCVIGFHTIDPRLMFPKKRRKALSNSKGF